jgi:hypothetical protein
MNDVGFRAASASQRLRGERWRDLGTTEFAFRNLQFAMNRQPATANRQVSLDGRL